MLGVLAVAAMAPAAAATLPLSSTGGFPAAVARYRAAKAASDRFDATTYAAAIRAHDFAVIAFDKANPHSEFRIGSRTVSTENWREARHIRREMTNLRYLERCAWDDHRNDMLFLDAYDARDAALKALPERRRMDAMTDRSDALDDVEYQALMAAIATPVANLTDLAAKFDLIEECGQIDDNPSVRATFRADLARLAAGGLN
jgi:hypothetical protein